MKTQRIVAFLALALGLATTASAEEWWLKEAITKTNPFTTFGSWTNAQGQAAADLAIENFTSADALHLVGTDDYRYGILLTANSSFDGEFHAGSGAEAAAPSVNLSNYDLNLAQLKWHNATFRINSAKKLGILTGAATLDMPAKTHAIGVIGSQYGGFILGSALTCADSNMQVTISTSSGDTYYIGLAGDNAGYHGNFKQSTSLTPLFIGHANALGSPSDSRSDALLIDAANAVFSVVKGVTPNAARGIEINKDGFRICATNYAGFAERASDYRDCTEFELPMPITGEYGFTKSGPGTVTLSGAYTASNIVVESGTLVITSSAEFPAGQNISVASGAALYVHQPLSRFIITQAEGATVEYVLDTLDVAYDDSTRTATPLSRGSSFSVPDGVKQPIALSSAISLPLDDGLQFEVLTVASGAEELFADDFIDETPKTFGLPKTSFEVSNDVAGVQHVLLNVRPVVVSVATFTNTGNNSLNTSSSCWSNGDEAQLGYDYLVTNQINRVPATSFSGDSLTIANAAESGDPMNLYTRGNGTLDAVIYAGACGVNIEQNTKNGGGCFTTSGNLYIAGDYDDSGYVRFTSKYCPTSDTDAEWISYGSYWHRLSANLSGEGPLMLYAPNSTTATKGNPQLYGDNSAYKGKIYVTYSGSNKYLADGVGVALTFNSANALGGALDEFKYDSLTLDKYSTLRPTTSIDFSTENRGIYGSGPFGFDVTNGITFKVGVPVKMDDIMFKHGEGDLILGGEISYGGSSTKTCYVREGGIGALGDAAVAGLNVVFSNGTKIVVAPDATLVNGFTGVSFEPADATVVVGFASDFTPPANGASFTVAIATVPASAGDLSSRFTLERLRGYTGTITTENVVVDEVSCIRYSAKYVHSGMVINVL